MTSLCQQDQEFLKSIEGQWDLVASHKVYGLMRFGHLLLVLPHDKRLALKVLDLYQPQNPVAKMLARCLAYGIRLGFVRMLKSLVLVVREDSPLAEIASHGKFGFLLGNPARDARRLICMHETGGQSLVSKIGIGGVSRETVVKEIEGMLGAAKGLKGVPKILNHRVERGYASYTVDWVNGKSPAIGDEKRMLQLLQSWESDKKLQPIGDLGFWDEFYHAVPLGEERDFLDSIRGLLVKETVVHGDFAPWNVKCGKDGEITVLDWEFCKIGGAAGIDEAHYVFQTCLLVKNMSCCEAMDYVKQWAVTSGQIYLEGAGWHKNLHEWVGVYLLYTQYVLGMDRKDLLKCWKEKV